MKYVKQMMIEPRMTVGQLVEEMKAANFYAPGLMALRPDLAECFEDGSVFIWDVKSRCMAQHVGQVLLYKTSAETDGRKVRGAGIICLKADHVAKDVAEKVGIRIEMISPEEL